MVQKKNSQRRYKALPPHTYEAFPVANAGEANKPFVIAIIVVLGIIVLSLILFSRGLFVGKAFSGVQGTAGIEDPSAPPVENSAFSLPISANIGSARTVAINFTLQLPQSLTCADVSSSNSPLWPDSGLNILGCSNNVFEFTSATYDISEARTGTFEIGQIFFPRGLPQGSYDFTFSDFTIIDADNPQQSNPNHDLIGDGLGVTVTVSSPPSNDVDNDGIPNAQDQCPDTAVGELVDANGCASSQLDADGDSIPDSQDQCPATTVGTPVDNVGCPLSAVTQDADNDDVIDDNDLCPNTPAGAVVDADGCSVEVAVDQGCFTATGDLLHLGACGDPDGDGITEDVDLCENTPTGEPVGADGCPVAAAPQDADGDGVVDAQDQCVNTPAGTRVDANGCPVVTTTTTTFTTRITATTTIPEATVYTLLKDANGKILVLKREQMLNVQQGEEYIASVAYPSASLVRSKEVVVYDRLPHEGWTIHGSLVVPDVNVPPTTAKQEVGITLQ